LRLPGWLADEDAGERRGRVHLAVRQEPELFELGGGHEVGLVDHDHDPAVAFGFLGGEQVGGLGHHLDFVETGVSAEGAHDADVEAAGAEGGVGDVDHLVAGGRPATAATPPQSCRRRIADHATRAASATRGNPGTASPWAARRSHGGDGWRTVSG
jgi:hypothetical protein